MLKQLFMTLGALTLLQLAGCGRITAGAVTPPHTRSLAGPTPGTPPADLVGADREARATAGLDAKAALVYAMLGEFDGNGQPRDSVGTGAVLRYALANGSLTTVYIDYQDRPQVYRGVVNVITGAGVQLHFADARVKKPADGTPLSIGRLPAPARAVAMARAAGLAGDMYSVAYANVDGAPVLLVGHLTVDTDGGGRTYVDATRVFDATTGKPVAATEAPGDDPVYDPGATPAAPAATDNPAS